MPCHALLCSALQDRLGFEPVAVHTTFQFGDTAEFAWGKRSRLRERLMWTVDPDDYFAMEGSYAAGTGAEETGFRGFLQLTGDVSAVPRGLRRREVSARSPHRFVACSDGRSRPQADYAVKLEGTKDWVEPLLSKPPVSIDAMDQGDPNYHLVLDSFQRRLVHDAMALGRATKRKVIMPRLSCWVDRYWNCLEKGRFPGVSLQQHPARPAALTPPLSAPGMPRHTRGSASPNGPYLCEICIPSPGAVRLSL
jgi:hypothetical protein